MPWGTRAHKLCRAAAVEGSLDGGIPQGDEALLLQGLGSGQHSPGGPLGDSSCHSGTESPVNIPLSLVAEAEEDSWVGCPVQGAC